MSNKELSHIDKNDKASMVDVSGKAITKRTAVAQSLVKLTPEICALFEGGDIQSKKGAVFGIAQIAGIMAAKKTSDLIPLCHPLSLDNCHLEFELIEDSTVQIRSTAITTGKTGVEMEALTGASVAALCIYDMCKAMSHDICIKETRLLSKTGGKSDYRYV